MIARLAATFICLAACAASPAQEAPPVRSAADVRRAVERAYRDAPVAERITISVRTAAAPAEGPPRPPRTGQSVIVLRAARALEPRESSMLLEFPALALWFGKGRAVGVTRPPSKAAFVRDIGTASIPRAVEWTLPSLALPQLALVFGPEDPWTSLSPFCPGATWDGAVYSNPEGEIELRARWSAGQVRLGLDPTTSRVRTFEIFSQSGGETSQLALKCVPIEPGDPASWEISPAGERLVPTLRELVTPAADPAPDNPFAALLLQDEALAPFSPADDFLAPPRPGSMPPRALVLIIFRAGDQAAPVPESVLAAARAVHEVQRLRIRAAVAGEARAILPQWRPLALFDITAFTREALQRTAQAFRSLASPGADALPGTREALPLVWTLAAEDLLRVLTSGESAAVAVVGPDLRAIRTIPLRERADPLGLAREIEEAVKLLE